MACGGFSHNLRMRINASLGVSGFASLRYYRSMVAIARRTYQMLDNETLWEIAVKVHETLSGAGIPHAIVGGVAVCLHGYRRNTVDVDWLVRRDDLAAIRDLL